MSDAVALQYRAFISYSQHDAGWAKWLQRWLEGFRGEKDLIGRDATGTIHTTLRSIFCHPDDSASSQALTLAALDASHALIVICSPAAAKSDNVSEDIRLFKSRHPERPVIPLIVDGKPGDAALECFPPALKFKLDADGKITDEPIEVLAADARAEGDGETLALAKMVGRVLGVSADEVYHRSERGFRRAKRADRRRAWLRGGIATVFLALVALTGVFTYSNSVKFADLIRYEIQRQETLAGVEALVAKFGAIDSAGTSTPEAGPSVTEAISSISEGATLEPRYARALELLGAGKYQEAEPLLEAVAEDKKRLASSKEAAEALRSLASIAAIADHGKARGYYAEAAALDRDHVEGMFWHGWFQAEAGSLNQAETAYWRVISTAKTKEDDWALYWARLGVGDIRLSRGDPSAAIAAYQAASEMADRLAKSDPDKSDLPVAYFKVGDVLMAQGHLTEALQSYRKGLAIIERLAKADPDNTGWQRDLIAIYGRVGSVLAQQGEKILARDTFYRGRAITAQLKDRFTDDALAKRLTAFEAEIAKLEQAQAAEPRLVQPKQAAR